MSDGGIAPPSAGTGGPTASDQPNTVTGGAQAATGAATGAATTTDTTGTGTTLFGFPLGNWVERGFLVIIGLTIVAFGLWHLFTAPSPTRSAPP